MSEPSEIDEWRNKVRHYRELAVLTGSAVTRDLLEDLARAAEAMAEEIAGKERNDKAARIA
jgi:hypothetical protein